MLAESREMTGDGVLVILPTYNEALNIRALLREIRVNAPSVDILVVDDNSPDGTGEAALAAAEKEGKIRVLEREGKLGLGTAYLAGFEQALSGGYAFAVTMDSDFSHHPRHLPAILAEARRPATDVVIGSRYVKGGGVVGWGLSRRVLSFGANAFARLMLRLPARDCTGGYRCYSRAVLENLGRTTVLSHGYSALVELLWHCSKAGFVTREVPITFRDRTLGDSKISQSEIMRGVTTVLRLAVRRD